MSRLGSACLSWVLIGCGVDGSPPLVSTHVDDWRDQVVYEIVVDRFADGDPGNDVLDGIPTVPGDLARFQGGDWLGVIEHLDYIQHLGVTALWLSPPYANIQRTQHEDGYHGYWPSDYTRQNPRFGSMDDLRELTREAHSRGMLVLLDVVPNHAGRVFDYDLNGDGQVEQDEIEPPFSSAPYDVPLLWTVHPRMFLPGMDGSDTLLTLEAPHFHRRGSGDLSDPAQKKLSDFPTGLRDLNSENQEVIDGLVESHVWWVEQTDVDGFRIDAVPHVPHAFWTQFCSRLRTRLAALGKERFLLLGEVFTGDPRTLASYDDLDELDSAFAFDLKFDLIDGVIYQGGPPSAARGALSGNRMFFQASPQPNGIGLDPWEGRVSFADNHDLPRIRGELDDPLAAQIALTVVFTVDAIPCVYYGTEQGLGGRSHHQVRQPLWRTGFSEDTPTFRFIQKLAAIRQRSSALRRGLLTVRYASESGGADPEPAADAGMFAYERKDEGERVLVVVNSAIVDSVAVVPTGFAPATRLYDALGATTEPWVVAADRNVHIRLPGRASVILERH